ncbi:hypothetical protein EQ500_10745 [Lactobacillus sp. XV13L]|nr:hypothetical protein [Lactobacillus sp. XV13L]
MAGLSGLKYEDNQIILYYLAAVGSYQLKQYVQAITYLTQGIRFAADHNSHYLLANDYYLLAHVAKATGNDQQQRESLAHQQFLSELFNEKIYRNL